MKPDPKKIAKKPPPGVMGDKKNLQPKSPAPKKTKDIVYSKLFIVQQQYKESDFKNYEEK